MVLTDSQRKAIMGWLEVIKGGKEMIKKVNVRGGSAQGRYLFLGTTESTSLRLGRQID